MIKNIPENERESLGELLHRTREELGLSLEEVAEATKISLYNLKAIEEDDYANLPAEVFVRGFCGIYAVHLSLDPEMIRERFNEQKVNMPRRSTKRAPTPTQLALETSNMAERPAVTSHSIIGLSLLAIFIVVTAISWYLSWNPATYLSQKLRGVPEQPTVSTEPKDTLTDEATDNTITKTALPSTAPVVGTDTPASEKAMTEELAQEKPIVVPPIVPIATPPVTQSTKENASPPVSVPSGQIAPPALPGKSAHSSGSSTYLLKASSKEATHITVKIDENPAERFVLAAGQSRSWNAGKSITITLPAGTGTTFTLNDIPLNLPKKDPGQEITISIPEYLLE
ncbi:MAG: helix-turn-helix domain-containing protein [Desulfoprunum sp.]|nr:helix-turn-helix domain-containing protein [Desulfoprunum sp.]